MFDLTRLEQAARYEGGMSRRLFLAYAASLSSLPLLERQAAAKSRRAKFCSDPFTLGVASGDSTPTGVVLWTRLAPKPLEPGGGLSPQNLKVCWEIASDEGMRKIVRRGTSVATSELAHSVHVEVEGLKPDRWYWYRFRAADAESPVGRTRTMPAGEAMPGQLQFAFASCQHYEMGYFTAYEHMAKDDLDAVLHLGDYIYENAGEKGRVRRHIGKELHSLNDYRIRHAQYKTDLLLQAAHALCPWFVTWDDHEVANDYANDLSQHNDVDPVAFLRRRANAYQAYYEMMPLRASSMPRGADMKIYRQASFGQLANFMVLDGRQYRSDQPNDDKLSDINAACRSPKCTMLGKQQYNWLEKSLGNSSAKWNVLANQVPIAIIDFETGDGHKYAMDDWAGYMTERDRLVEFLDERKVSNPVFITGDNHTNYVSDLRVDDPNGKAPVVATEFVGTSIASGGTPDADKLKHFKRIKEKNPSVHFANGERGYVRCTLTPEKWQTDFRVVPDISRPHVAATTRASYVIEAGKPGAQLA